ncbi:MAG: glycoside hydrolase family 38 C-terminal domain-containing protein, partial [Phycisphaerales bacterium]
NPDQMVTFQYFDIFDEDGKKIPFKILERENIDLEVERKLDSNAAVYDILRNRVLLEVDVPPMGYRTYAVRPRKPNYVFAPQPEGSRPLIALPNGILENEYLKVLINHNGTLNVLDKTSGRQVNGLHYFCDDASTGNAHKHKGTLRDFTVTGLCEKAILTLIENNALRASWKIDIEMAIPDSADINNRNRSQTKVLLKISTLITLKKGSKLVEFKTIIDNNARDHRLRVMFPTGICTNYSYADSAFDVIKRSVLWDQVGDNMEAYHPYKPMQRFVTVSDDKEGFSFIAKGLNEYEVIDDPQRTLAITLLRTSRAYMRANRGLMTPDEYARNIDKQCLGRLEFEYAICLHEGNWNKGGIHLAADAFRMPMRVIQGVPKKGPLPSTQSLFTLEPADDIQISAFYKSEEAGGYILRLWNTKDNDVKTRIKFNTDIVSVESVSLDEESKHETLKVSNAAIELIIMPFKIVTLLLKTQ